MQIVLASRNDGKLRELRALFAQLPVQLKGQAELNIPSPEETGTTFVENAVIKARFSAAHSGLPAIADDSGIVVPALDGAPGVISARYAGEGASDADNNAKLVRAIEHIDDRRAYYYCVIVMLRHADDPAPIITSASWWGELITQPRGEAGFGYDPYFWLPDLQQTSAQLNPAHKNQLSHRGQASRALVAQLQAELSGAEI